MKRINSIITKSAAASGKVIAQFLTTAEALQRENDEVAKALDLIRAEERQLAELRESGETLRAENTVIIDRMTEFVKGAR